MPISPSCSPYAAASKSRCTSTTPACPTALARSREAGQPETVEEAARNLRYECFAQLIAEGHADSVITAHTLDDQAETVLMKLLRGAWTDGLSGIHPVVTVPHATRPGRILRPLLAVRRADLEDFLRARKQPWRTDSSNADEAFTRNRVRRHLLPILREYNPGVDQALANLADLAREDEARWQVELGRILSQVLLPGKPVRGGGRAVSTAPGEALVAIDLERLRSFDPALRRRVVRAAARQLGARLTFDDTARLLALAGFGDRSDRLRASRLQPATRRRPARRTLRARTAPSPQTVSLKSGRAARSSPKRCNPRLLPAGR